MAGLAQLVCCHHEQHWLHLRMRRMHNAQLRMRRMHNAQLRMRRMHNAQLRMRISPQLRGWDSIFPGHKAQATQWLCTCAVSSGSALLEYYQITSNAKRSSSWTLVAPYRQVEKNAERGKLSKLL